MRLLVALALLLAAAGCGDDVQPIPGPTAQTPEIVLVSQAAGGGEVEGRATDVTAEADLTAYVDRFDDPLAAQVVEAAEKLAGTVLAQVVHIGCDVPPSAHLRGGVLVAAKIDDPLKKCFAPVTTVALAGRR